MLEKEIFKNLELIAFPVIIILITVLTSYISNRFFKGLIKRSTDDIKNDPTNYQFLHHATNGLIYIFGISMAAYAIPQLKVLASSLLAGAGVMALAVGFASQHALSNIVSGVFLVIFKPFRIKDRIKIRELVGVVEDITLRHTVMRDFENKRIVIPNSIISDEIIINSNLGSNICKFIDVGISYDSDLHLAKAIIKDEILKHPLIIDHRTPEQIELGEEMGTVRVLGFGESAVNLRGWAWAKDAPDAFVMACDIYESIKFRFDNEGIEIPFPHRIVILKNKKESGQ